MLAKAKLWQGYLFTKTSIVRSRWKWEANIRMDLKQMVYDIVNWIPLVQNRDKSQGLVNLQVL